MKQGKHRLLGWMVGLVAAAVLITGCDHGEGTVIIEEDDDPPVCTGLVEGTAYYPFYGADPEPVYYDDENIDIFVTLYDEFDFIVSEVVTGPSGFFEFDHLPPGYYYLTAQAETYAAEVDLFDIYLAETPLFWVGECDWIDEKNLFLEYSHSEF